MYRSELKAAIHLSAVVFLRMFGVFLPMPIIALMIQDIPNATPANLGFALGVYGLTQALCQIPLGRLSDRWGRKPIAIAGLLVFILGSVLASMAESIIALIIGRSLQGAGAISATIMALAADLSRASERTKMMAIIGASVGVAFGLAFILAPIIYQALSYRGIFLIAGSGAIFAILILIVLVPTPKAHLNQSQSHSIKKLLSTPKVFIPVLCVFFSHLIIAANLTVLPIILTGVSNIAVGNHWQFYLPVLLISVAIAAPALIFSKHLPSQFFSLLVGLIWLSQLCSAAFYTSYTLLFGFSVLFFIGFNYLEAFLPAQISQDSPANTKGATLGIYATMQFIGIFIGGVAGGLIHQHYGISTVYMSCSILAFAWLIVVYISLRAKESHTHLA